MFSFKRLIFPLIAVGALFYLLYLKGYILANFKSVTPREAASLIAQSPQTVILDVRTPEEYRQSRLKGARLLPLSQIERALAEGKLAAIGEKPLIVYCRSGTRSAVASRILADHGLRPLNLKGGILAWQKAGLPVEK